ncbi:ATP-dependent nuclease [Bacillus cereus]|uniref:ATP-dependent nuclease n=1 Tax=Bacillus cereus TaxID=1396 RepID=UPI00256FE92B|nr:ATP-dependent endonuclease [Bacillus cereus]WJE24768.1 ATP-dependent endonuclease [Bacillus cereus]
MKIKKIKVSNYRLLKNMIFDMEENLSLIIGKNNCGKTSLLSAFEKFIGVKVGGNDFCYDDFNMDFQEELYSIVKLNSIPTGLRFPMGIKLQLFITYDEFDNLINMSQLMMDLDPENNTIILSFEYTLSNDSLENLINEFKEYKDKKLEKVEEDSESLEQNIFNDFMKKNHKKYFKIWRKSVAYDWEKQKENEVEFVDLTKRNIALNKIINFKTIGARRNISNSNNDRTLSTLSSKYYESKTDSEKGIEEVEVFKETLSKTDNELDSVYKQLFKTVIGKVKQFGGIKEGDSNIRIVSTLQHKELLKGNTTVMYEHFEKQTLPESYNGLGYLNLLSMIFEIELIISNFRKEHKKNEMPADINILFIEEPEAHTHPQMQYIFINNIKKILEEASIGDDGKTKFNLQTLITTHSAHITNASNYNDIKYFYKENKNEVISKNLKDLEKEYEKDGEEQNYKFLKQYLTIHRSELFFADKAIFIEGDTERILLPAMMKKIDNNSEFKSSPPLHSQNISILEVGAYSHIFEKFINFIGIKSLIITDIDSGKNVIVKEKEKIEKCRVLDSDAELTTNSSLKFFYKNGLEENKRSVIYKNELDYFKKLSFNQKILQKIKETKNWEKSEKGNIAIIYQTSEENSKGEKYHARSFEDAFFHLNRQFVIENKENFDSLKNIKRFEDEKKDVYDLSEECIDKKPSFAMEILLNSKIDVDGNEYSNWEIPNYIKEGLIWLKCN